MSSLRTLLRLGPTIVLATALAACVDSSGGGTPARPSPAPRGKPTGASSALTIGAAGGQITSADGNLAIEVPAGAVAADTDFTIVEITNTAPGGVGAAYRLGPPGLLLLQPVTLTFKVPASVTSSVTALSVSTQPGEDPTSFWFRVPAGGDEGARTLTAAVRHFSDWALTTGTTIQDLNGPVQIVSTLDQPFTANGWATLGYAGGGASLAYYIAGGSLTIQPVTVSGGTCTAASPTWTLLANIATLEPGPKFGYGLSGLWDLACVDGGGAPIAGTTVSFALDTEGISHYDCLQGWIGTPTLTASRVLATYRVDCGARGSIVAILDLVSCTPAAPCETNLGLCWKGTTSCATGRPECVDSTTAKDAGTTCGADLVCDAGSCNACAKDQPCTTNPNPCVEGRTSCATGTSSCLDSTAALANGLGCGTGQVCNAGACVACASGGDCSANPEPVCSPGKFSCQTGLQVCVNGPPAQDGLDCGTGQVCNAGACVACASGGDCSTNPDPVCSPGVFSCQSGAQACVNGPALADGTSCGSALYCNAGACGACVAGGGCATNPEPECAPGAFTCDVDGVQTCANGPAVLDGTTCSLGICVAGSCTPP